MARARATDLVIAVVALAVAALATIGIFALGSQGSADRSPVSRGEAIFQSGVDADGDPIPRSASGGGMMGGGMMGGGGMLGGGCASCHGGDGTGRSTGMFVAPDITYKNLTDPAGMREPDGSRGHTFTDEQIKRAVTEGVDAEGEPLSWPMPQWQLTDSEWSDLLAYLKTLR